MQQYNEFVDKFKPRYTSDDTHTLPNVYEAVLSWAERRYGFDRARVVRPFFPGGDYEHADYPADCIVLDNPPFSILSQIVRFYLGRSIPFFLFAPGLVCLSHARHPGVAAIFSESRIIYDNGAQVATGFLTSLEPPDTLAVSAPSLHDAIAAATAAACKKSRRRTATRLELPDELVSGARMQYLAAHHAPYTVRRSEAAYVHKLDNYPGNIYGGGFLLSPRTAADFAANRKRGKVELSAREKKLIASLCPSAPPRDNPANPVNPV